MKPELHKGSGSRLRHWAWFAVLAVGLLGAGAQGLPEPGVILYGSVTNATTGQGLTSGTVALTFTNGANTVTVSAPITNVGGQFLYVAEVPFETVAEGLIASPTTALPLPGTTASFGRGAKVDGTNAVVLDAAGVSFPVSSADRGRQLRVNLQLSPSGGGETYEAWSTRFFGLPNADPNADSDSDGRTNLQEYQDGTSPVDENSVVRVLAVAAATGGSVTRSPNQTNFLNGAAATLTAVPAAGYFFNGWTGDTNTVANPLSLTMTRGYAVTPRFEPLTNAFATVTNQTVAEGSLLMFTNLATNFSTVTTLRFSLAAGAPPGSALDATNGVFTWTPTESQGPSTNLFQFLLADTNNAGTFATQMVSIVVTEVNTAPVLVAVPNQTVAELTTLAVNLSATESDLPANTLTYEKVSGPAALTVNGTSGLVSWTPGEADGPSTNLVTIRVVDNGTPSLSATQSFQVIVTEVNTAPVLAAVGTLSATEGVELARVLVASDSDLPANALSFELLSAPAGMQVGSVSGILNWIPTTPQAGSSNFVSVRVVDSGSPPLSATQSFTVLVAALPAPEILRLDPTNFLFVARTNLTNAMPVQFSVTATNFTGFQWSFGGQPIVGATNATLSLADVRRTNSGTYSVLVTGQGGTATSNALLHVATPQRVRTVQRLAGGSFRLLFNDEDGVPATDLSRFRVQASSALLKPETNIIWVEVSGSFSSTNGFILFDDTTSPGLHRRFYRVIER